jgi:predicted cupin superfamily sugar epimerase
MSANQPAGQSPHSAQVVIEELIREWQLQPHPEGGWYRELHRSHTMVKRGDGSERTAITTILYLLDGTHCSRWHRVRHADEVWTHLQGACLSLWSLQNGKAHQQVLSLQNPVAVIPADVWQAAKAEGPYSLVSCNVGPGFAFDDFELLRDLPKEQWPEGVLAELS